MLKRIAAIFSALFLIPAVSVKASSPPELSAVSAILMDAESGRVLFEQNAYEERAIASITKLMTALVAVESGFELNEEIIVQPEWTGIEGSSIYLRTGETVTLEALLYGLLLNSGNDAAIAVASHCGGSVDAFVQRMNQCAQRLGMKQTHFKNPNGLSEAGHYSTAYDMALLAAACCKNEVVSRIASTKSITFGTRSFTNHNKLLWRYKGCTGMKTGYTEASGRTLVSSAQRNGQMLIAVTLNAPNDWSDHASLFDYGFEIFSRQKLCSSGEVLCVAPVWGSLVRFMPVLIEGNLYFPLAEGEKVQSKVMWNHSLKAPIERGDLLGTFSVYLEGELIGATGLYAGKTVFCDVVDPLKWKEPLRSFLNRTT